ncbi:MULTISPECIES: GNAT family N-acetyltransferase [Protofrankia]|uniref:Acetyltransferase n=1 Tax=Protofrankia coriariae TaxID=1562887 RepID=A0ABR5F2V8_9ACTN|nr:MULTISPECIES: GNAT family N-acetyltransferase [Protofrankia]KLL11029.1 acetyltransferase [Protofrankia coriariae]ONH33953.1 GNAT family N-acetyltransferase [Protofrankia sp. BMG5.30]
MTLHFGQPTTVTIPTVITDRLILRCWQPEDVGPYTAMAAHPDMSRYTGSPRDREAVWDMEAALTGHWHLCGFGMWAAEDRSSGEFVGRAGLYRPEGWPGIEAAWTIRRDRWGQGLATEAVSLIHPDNAASIRVAAKLGLTDAHRTFRGDAVYVAARRTWTSRIG